MDQFNTTSIRKFLTITSLCETKSENSHKLLSDNLHKFVNIVNRTLGGGHYKSMYVTEVTRFTPNIGGGGGGQTRPERDKIHTMSLSGLSNISRVVI